MDIHVFFISAGFLDSFLEASQGSGFTYVYFGVAALLAGFVLLLVMSKFKQKGKGGGSALNIDAGFLDGVADKGGLTKEEAKRVREIMVRQALKKQQNTIQPQTSLQDLNAIVHQQSDSQADPSPPPAAPRAAAPGPAPAAAPRPAVNASNPAAAPTRPPSRPAAMPTVQTGAPTARPGPIVTDNPGAQPTLSELIVSPPETDVNLDAGPSSLPSVAPRTRDANRSLVGNIEVGPAPTATSAAAKPPSARTPGAPPNGGGASEIDVLFQKDLIGREEYERLRRLSDRVK